MNKNKIKKRGGIMGAVSKNFCEKKDKLNPFPSNFENLWIKFKPQKLPFSSTYCPNKQLVSCFIAKLAINIDNVIVNNRKKKQFLLAIVKEMT